MKKLLIILALFYSSQVYSQTYKNLRIINYTPEVVGLLFEYEKDCYNDSSLIQIAVMKRSKCQESFNSNNMEIDYYITKLPIKYRHKEPTFGGFITWLHRQKFSPNYPFSNKNLKILNVDCNTGFYKPNN